MKKFLALVLAFLLSLSIAPINTLAVWKQNGNSTWSYTEKGKKVTGWKKIGGYWYCFNNSGIMQTGWIKSGGEWYHLKPSGAMTTGWLKSGGKWYYLEEDGAMARGLRKLSDGEYFFDTVNGYMYEFKEQSEVDEYYYTLLLMNNDSFGWMRGEYLDEKSYSDVYIRFSPNGKVKYLCEGTVIGGDVIYDEYEEIYKVNDEKLYIGNSVYDIVYMDYGAGPFMTIKARGNYNNDLSGHYEMVRNDSYSYFLGK